MTSTSNGNVPAMGNMERTMVDAVLVGQSTAERAEFMITTEGKYKDRIIVFNISGWYPTHFEPSWKDGGPRPTIVNLGLLIKPNTGTEAKMEIEEWS